MRRAGSFVGVLLSVMAVPLTASAVQTAIAETRVLHSDASGAFAAISTAALPADLTAPDDYAMGTLYHRVTVTAAGANAMTYRVCFTQGANTACSGNDIAINGAGQFEANQALSTLSNYAMIDWSMPIDSIQVAALDTAGAPIDASDMTWIGNPDFALYYPLDLTYEAVLVANGDAFEGYPSDPMGMPAEAPAISPDGGTFEGSVSVSLSTGQMDPMIYYTTDGTDPDNTSTLYDGTAISVMADTTVKAVTYATGFDPSPIVQADFSIVASLPNGLRGRYYDSENFEDLVGSRTDRTIDFMWEGGSPPFADQGNGYSILWTGQVTPRYTDTYTFKTVNDDGVRLWINNQLIIDDWNFHGPEERRGTISLSADQPATVWLEYFNGGGPGSISFSWESPQQPDEIIPESALVPDLPAGQRPVISILPPSEESYPEIQLDSIVISLRRSGDIDTRVVPAVEYTGDAVRGEDYGLVDFNYPFEPGVLASTIEIPLTNDTLVEGDETVTITLKESALYEISGDPSITFTITDDDVQTDSISGNVIYTGTESGKIIVEAFRETDPVFAKRRVSLLNPGPYSFADLEEGSYNVVAYVDTNDNEQLDEDEIWGVYQDANLLPALVTIPPGQMGIDINLDVAPGEDPNAEEDEGGCCATVNRPSSSGAWLAAVLLGMLGWRRRRRD